MFPSALGKPLSDATLSKRLRDLQIPTVFHSFRANFRTGASEQTDAPRAVMESALAHRLGDMTEEAYARSDLFEKRRAVMDGWTDYLSAAKAPANVTAASRRGPRRNSPKTVSRVELRRAK